MELANIEEMDRPYSSYGIEDIADSIMKSLMDDTSLSNAGISLEGLNPQQEKVLSDALLNALTEAGEEYNMVL